MTDERAASRPAPAASPNRPVPAAKKKKKSDALALAQPGEQFDVTVELEARVYGVASVTVLMKKDESTGLTVCLAAGCRNRAWCNGAKTNAWHFACGHVRAHHSPEKLDNALRTMDDGAVAKVTVRPTGIMKFCQKIAPPPKTPALSLAEMRAGAAAASAPPCSADLGPRARAAPGLARFSKNFFSRPRARGHLLAVITPTENFLAAPWNSPSTSRSPL